MNTFSKKPGRQHPLAEGGGEEERFERGEIITSEDQKKLFYGGLATSSSLCDPKKRPKQQHTVVRDSLLLRSEMRARLLTLPLDLFCSTPPCRRGEKRVILFYKEFKDGTEERNWNKREKYCTQ